jgi:glucose/arabinose dehydrogenase
MRSPIPLLALLVAACTNDPSFANSAPTVVLLSPGPGVSYAGGEQVAVSLTGSDPDDGTLPAGQLSWWIDFHHATHTHPFVGSTTGTGAIVDIPQVGHPETDVWYRVYARAVDQSGVADTVFVDIQPRLTTIALATLPAGFAVTVDGQPRTTPSTIPSVVGMLRSVGAPYPQSTVDSTYAFSSWSDAGSATHDVLATDAPLALTATFVATGRANTAPTVTLASPVAGATFTMGTPAALSVDATDTDGTIVLAQFLVGNEIVGEVEAAPFEFAWLPDGLGARSIRARVFDNDGGMAESAPAMVTVLAAGSGDVTAPVAALTSPVVGSLGLTGTVELTATATDDVGVASVEFEVDGAPLAADASAPFAATLPSTGAYASGAHVLRARARDAAGNRSPWSTAVVTFGGAVALPAGFSRTVAASGFGELLTSIAFAPDGRIFATELTGAVRVVKNGVLLPQPFVTVPALTGGERGLIGIALDPAFATNGHVYVHYTTADGGVHNRVSRFTANGDVAASGSELVLLDLPSLSAAQRHNGGGLQFSADGMLYIAVGDDGVSANAPLITTPFGKILRINADGTIPTDNPFYFAASGINRAIWAKGLRNPYTFAISRATGRMLINDVGQETWEEVNLGRRGADYGWPATEGETANPAYDSPLLAVRHSASPTLFDANAFVGAAFYEPANPRFGAGYTGDYFFADYVLGWIYRMDVANGNAVYAFAQPSHENITGLGVGPDGVLYLLVGTRIDRITR